MPGFDEKILALYADGITTRDIQGIVLDLYGVEVSPTLISEITADPDAQVTTWRTRWPDAVWSILYFDGILVHVRGENGRVSQQHTVYVALGVNLEGKKELILLWLSETEVPTPSAVANELADRITYYLFGKPRLGAVFGIWRRIHL